MADNDEGASNTPEVEQTNVKFTPDEIARYFKGTWKVKECEVCHSEERWNIATERPLSVMPVSDGNRISVLSEGVTVHLRVNCSNCGNTKFFMAQVVRRWLNNNP